MNIDELYQELSAPAQRALRSLDLKAIEDLAKFTRKEISELHGIGPNALKVIETRMALSSLSFTDEIKKHAQNTKDDLISEYIGKFPSQTQTLLKRIRTIISNAAPDAIEKISYQMPTFYYFGNLVHFAGHEKHIGFYPTPTGISNFEKELREYKTSEGAIQFPLDKPLPVKLIEKIVEFRVRENTINHEKKAGTKK